MSIYEICALFLSIIAILIPIIQWIWKKCIVKPKLIFYPTGKAYLFSNRSGSYIRIEGVFEALNKPVSVKNVTLKIIRKKDDVVLNLRWSMFINPTNQHILGAYTSATEIAHPFRIDSENVVCAFAEYTDFYGSAEKKLQPYIEAIVDDLTKIDLSDKDYPNALREYYALDSYKDAREVLTKELFWEIGKYEVKMDVEYGKTDTVFQFGFEVSKETYMDLVFNIDEILLSFFKNQFNQPTTLKTVQVEIKENKK